MSRIYKLLVVISLLFVISTQNIFAKSSYVLPYPSTMPGSKFYVLNILKDKFNSLWYFGDLAKFAYHLQMSDKYLVEAKILFEYDQYLLAENSLKKSNLFYQELSLDIKKAKQNRKNTSQIEDIYRQAREKHIEVLEKIENELPSEFLWTPEKDKPTNINIKKLIDDSILIRK